MDRLIEIESISHSNPTGFWITTQEVEWLLAEIRRLRTEIRSYEWGQAHTEIERLKREVDYWMNLDAAAIEAKNERLQAAIDKTWRPEVKALREQIKRLQDALDVEHDIRAEQS